eukprot:CAMPEP_0205950998 /NCGR_PEP_ID=MMETSP1459-20131121/2681_1 /ASSEMBLY_ACC=CAM_ASM_001120 /TAXON_ID=41880 /ORGANISM="Pycnococcus provasolii, Strain RCC931" /LENGTH=217 /DNA_ID=CAMNT_0053322695 /DNA_START=50 /DNA_END=704 /DNA_ORIENTATION=-
MTTPISLSIWLRDNKQQIALNCVNGRLLDKSDSRFVTEAAERAISARSHVENDFLARFERGQAAVRASFTPERVTEAAASAPARLWVVEHFLRDEGFSGTSPLASASARPHEQFAHAFRGLLPHPPPPPSPPSFVVSVSTAGGGARSSSRSSASSSTKSSAVSVTFAFVGAGAGAVAAVFLLSGTAAPALHAGFFATTNVLSDTAASTNPARSSAFA